MSSSSPDYSYKNMNGSGSIESSFEPTAAAPNFYGTKHSSTYVPHNRLSRYTTAISNLLPIRFGSGTPGSELPLDKIGLFSSVSFSWLNEYLSAGCRNTLNEKSLPTVPHQDSCQVNGARLDGLWHTHVVERGQTGASVPLIAWKFIRTRVLVASMIYFLGLLLSLLSPTLVLQQIIAAMEERNDIRDNLNSTAYSSLNLSNPDKANISSLTNSTSKNIPDSLKLQMTMDEVIIFTHLMVLLVIELISYFLIAWSASLNLRTAARLQAACLALAYKKMARSAVRQDVSAHQTLTYSVPDSETLYELISNGPLIITGPGILFLTSLYIWFSLGRWALIGVVSLIFLYSCLILTAYLTKVFAVKRTEYSMHRMSIMEELMNNIYASKVSLWDFFFQHKIRDLRKEEVAELKLGGLSEGWSLCMVHLIPIVTMCIITITCLLIDKEIKLTYYMPVLMLLLLNLKHCVRNSWLAMSSISRGIASLNKLKNVLVLKDTDRHTDKPIDKDLAIAINHASFSWKADKMQIEKSTNRSSQFYLDNFGAVPMRLNATAPTDTLTDINFHVAKGKLIGICGEPASGKTSFLLALLGHLNHIGGYINMNGSCAYVPKKPWIFDGTLKENIIFEEPFDSSRYYKTIRYCSLNNDIVSLPASDDTVLSTINVNLSLQEKIAFARAIYMQRDIYLLDNPLENLDNQERREIFEKSILYSLNSKTVIIITDRIQFLNRCDNIYVMREGKFVADGTHEELVQTNDYYVQLINLFMSKYRHKSHESSRDNDKGFSPVELISRSVLSSMSTATSLNTINDFDESESLRKDTMERKFPVHYLQRFATQVQIRNYFKNCGGWFLIVFICILGVCYSSAVALSPASFTYVAKNVIITENSWIIGTFIATLTFTILCGFLLMVLYNKVTLDAAVKIHNKWLKYLSNAQLGVLLNTPVSTLLNICTLNLREVDSELPRCIVTMMMHIGITVFSITTLCVISLWLLLPSFAFLLICTYYTFYIRNLVLNLYEVQLNSVMPVYNHARNAIEGRVVIQTFHKEREFMKKFHKFCDNNTMFHFLLKSIKLWIEYRLKMLSVLLMGANLLLCASLNSLKDQSQLLGLAFTCTLQLTISTIYSIEAIIRVFAGFVAFNTLDNFVETIPQEKTAVLPNLTVIPVDSSISFTDVRILEEPSNSNTLLPLNLVISPGEKVAINVVENSLKRILVSILYKCLELPSGNIYIGNANIKNIPIDTLREQISVVPEEPYLFNGTIRYNLDPLNNKTDTTLMSALQKVYLWEKVAKLPKKLDDEANHVFTVHEKRLFFLARALLKNTKIVLIEQTNEWSPEIDLIDIILKEAFKEYTVIVFSTVPVKYCDKTYLLPRRGMSETSIGKKASKDSLLSSINSVFETNL